MWPFVGRQREFALLLAAVRNRRTRGLAVVGPAGIGKSRLVHEALAVLDPTRFAVRALVATPANSGVALGVLGALVPDPGAPGADQDVPVPSREALLRTVMSAVAGPADPRRPVIVVDDAHLLDAASGAVLRELARTGRAFVLVVLRAGRPVPEPLAALWTERLAGRMELASLRRAEVRCLLAAALGGPVAEPTVRRLSELAAGNPLLLRELVRAGRQAAALIPVENVWRWTGPWPVAPRLTELVRQRLDGLDDGQRWALELLALAEPVGSAVLERLAADEVLAVLEERGLVWVQQDGRRSVLRLAHPLYGEALRAGCPPLRARRAKRLLADALEATGARRRSDRLQIATWRLDSGVAPSAELLLVAARRAWTLLDLPLAERLGRQAVTTALSAMDTQRLVAAAQVLWRVLISGERYAELLSLLDGVAPMAPAGWQRVKVAFGRAETLFWGLGDVVAARRALPHPGEAGAGGPGQAEELAALQAMFPAFAGDLRPARAVIPALLARGMVNREAQARAQLLHRLALGYGEVAGEWAGGRPGERAGGRPGEPARAGPVPPQRPELVAVSSMPWLAPTAALVEVQAALLAGRVAEATDRAGRAHHAALTSGWEYALTAALIGRAQAARFAGSVADARHWLGEAVALHEPGTASGRLLHRLLYGELAHAEALAGHPVAAQDALDTADAVDWAPGRLLGLWAELARPWVAAAGGAGGERAAELALAAAEQAGRMAATAVATYALHDAARLGAGAAATARLSRLAGVGPYARYAVVVARSPGQDRCGHAAELEAMARHLTELGLHPLAAEAFGWAAEAYHGAGLSRPARRARASSAEQLRRCAGLRRLDLRPDAAGLTAREREVAALVLAGLTHRQAAQRLGVAKRTVDNHLLRIYAKLGVVNRDELRGVLEP